MTNDNNLGSTQLATVLGGVSEGPNCGGPSPDAWFGNFRWWLGEKIGLHKNCPQPTGPQ